MTQPRYCMWSWNGSISSAHHVLTEVVGYNQRHHPRQAKEELSIGSLHVHVLLMCEMAGTRVSQLGLNVILLYVKCMYLSVKTLCEMCVLVSENMTQYTCRRETMSQMATMFVYRPSGRGFNLMSEWTFKYKWLASALWSNQPYLGAKAKILRMWRQPVWYWLHDPLNADWCKKHAF